MISSGTGSPSKAMLWATSAGIAAQRWRSLASGDKRRHWAMFWIQFTHAQYATQSAP